MRVATTLFAMYLLAGPSLVATPTLAAAQTHVRDMRIETISLPGGIQAAGVYIDVDPVKVYRLAGMQEATKIGDAAWNRQRFEPLPQGVSAEVYSVNCGGVLTLVKRFASRTEYSIVDRRVKGDIDGCMGAYQHQPGYFVVVRVNRGSGSYFLPPKRVQRQVEDQSYFGQMWFEDTDFAIRLKFDIELF